MRERELKSYIVVTWVKIFAGVPYLASRERHFSLAFFEEGVTLCNQEN